MMWKLCRHPRAQWPLSLISTSSDEGAGRGSGHGDRPLVINLHDRTEWRTQWSMIEWVSEWSIECLLLMLKAEELEKEDLIEGQGRRSSALARGGGDDWKLLVRWDHATCGPYFCFLFAISSTRASRFPAASDAVMPLKIGVKKESFIFKLTYYCCSINLNLWPFHQMIFVL